MHPVLRLLVEGGRSSADLIRAAPRYGHKQTRGSRIAKHIVFAVLAMLAVAGVFVSHTRWKYTRCRRGPLEAIRTEAARLQADEFGATTSQSSEPSASAALSERSFHGAVATAQFLEFTRAALSGTAPSDECWTYETLLRCAKA
jgi:hypothetical protein